MINRKRCCPRCGCKLLARDNDRIFCLASDCEWDIESKRAEDKDIQEIHETKDNWHY